MGAVAAFVRSRPRSLVIVGLIAATFGPYVTSGLRTGQVVIYLAAAVAAGSRLPWWRRGHAPPLPVQVAVFLAWAAFLVAATLAWLLGTSPYSTGWVAAADDLMLPLATMLAVWFVTTPASRSRLLRVAALTTVVALCVNAVLAVGQAVGWVPLFQGFWLPLGETTSAVRSAAMGRFTGILNQPALAGLYYGIGMVLTVYVWRSRPYLTALPLSLLAVGAVLTASKAFFIACVPAVAVILLWRLRGNRKLLIAAASVLAATSAALVLAVALLPPLPGLAHLQRIVDNGLTLGTLTGNRYGGSNENRQLTSQVLHDSPLIGWGLGGVPSSTDSGFTHAFAYGGIMGVLGVLAVLVFMWRAVWRSRSHMPSEDVELGIAILFIVTVGNLGFPVFVGNRLSPVLWLLMMLVLAGTSRGMPALAPPASDMARRQRGESPRSRTRAAVLRLSFAARLPVRRRHDQHRAVSHRSPAAGKRTRRVRHHVVGDEAWARGLALIVLAAATAETVVATVMMLNGETNWGFALIGGLCTAVSTLPFLLTHLSIFSLWGPACLVITIGTGVRGLAMATLFPDAERIEALFLRGQTFADVLGPSLVVLASVCAVVGGYVVARRRTPLPQFTRRVSMPAWASFSDFGSRRLRLLVVGYALAGTIGTALYFWSVGGFDVRMYLRRTVYQPGGDFQSFGHWEFLARAGTVALLLYIAWSLYRSPRLRWRDWALIGVLALNAFAINVITTTRTDLLYVTLGALTLVHVLRGRISLKLLGTVALLVLLGIGALSGLRGGDSALGGLESGLSSAVMNRNGYDLSKSVTIIDAVPEELGYAYGGTLARYALAPIPRALWPEKPAISEGVTIGRELYGLENTGIPPGLTAEMVWNFGVPIAIVISLLVGVLLGLVERWSMTRSRDAVVPLLITAIVVLPLGKSVLGVSFGQAMSASAQALVLLAPLLIASAFAARARSARVADSQ